MTSPFGRGRRFGADEGLSQREKDRLAAEAEGRARGQSSPRRATDDLFRWETTPMHLATFTELCPKCERRFEVRAYGSTDNMKAQNRNLTLLVKEHIAADHTETPAEEAS